MRPRTTFLTLAIAISGPLAAQSTATSIPMSTSGIREWSIAVVRRAAAMIAAPAQWNRSDASDCKTGAATFTIRCAFNLAADQQAAAAAPTNLSAGIVKTMPRADCRMRKDATRIEGNCGDFFDEASVFSIERVKAVTTGVWTKSSSPTEVWAGTMTNAGAPADAAARSTVNAIAPGKYRTARLGQFNDDTTVTFAKLQEYFRAVEARVGEMSASEVLQSSDSVEIEIFPGGKGEIRTYNGWYPVSGFVSSDSTVRFQVDTSAQVAPNELDRAIIRRADAILASDAVWNRADNRKCAPNATTWSIYCAMEQATRELSGGFHHRRPALEAARIVIEERTKDRDYNHRLMDYNNDKSTTLADVHAIFAETLKRMMK